MIKKIILSFITTLTLLPAQTLQDSVERVLETNPVVLERLSNYRETAKDLSIARSEYLPTVDLVSSIGIEKTDTKNSTILPNDTSLNYYENSLTVMLNIFDGFSTTNKVDYQKSRIIAAAYNFIEKADDTAFELTRRYIEVIKQRELLVTARENVTINKEIYTKVKELYSAGVTTKSEMKKIESSLFLARSNLIVQKNNAMDAVFNFKKIYGERIDINSLEIPNFKVLLPKTLNEATIYSIRHNPSIMVANYNIKADQYLKNQKKKNYYPKVDLMVQQNLDSNTYGLETERNRFRAGVVLSYNLYRGGADKENVQKAVSTIYRDVEIKNELQRQTIEGLELSWSAYSMIDKQLVELIKYRDYSEETLSLYKEEYDIGKRTLLDLLSSQNDFINAKSQIIRATYDEIFAKYRILDSMGLLVAGVMGNDYVYMKKVGLIDTKAVKNEDKLPISYDRDNDNLSSDEDSCPASLLNSDVLSNGCINMSKKISSVKHYDLLFFNRKNHTLKSKKILNAIINDIKNSNNILKIIIQAHASGSQNESTNFKTSQKYADFIKKSFTNAGVDQKRIKTISDANNAPISSNNNLNDRVNVIIYKK